MARVELEPRTGRKHQLRRHLAHLRVILVIGDSSMAICDKTAAPQSILPRRVARCFMPVGLN